MALIEKNKLKILFVASSPEDQGVLYAGKEQRKIEEALGLSSEKDNIEFVSKQGAKLTTITRELMRIKPNIVHFSGHGNETGLAFEDDNGSTKLVSSAAIFNLFSQFNDFVNLIILSACYSSEQAQNISNGGIYVIGMNDSVGVDDATSFVEGLYQAIGEGYNFVDAFKMGMVHYLSECTPEDSNIPELWFNGIKQN